MAARLETVRARILAAGGDPGSIEIVAVTKGRPPDACREAVALGLHTLGENRVQEALPKIAEVRGASWHLIGHLQSNKVRLAAGRFSLIQSVDSARLAEAIARHAPSQRVLVQVNVSREAGKQGVAPEDALELCALVADGLGLDGLMGMGPAVGDPAPAFRALADLRRRAEQRLGRPLPLLSMGMSEDLEAAVAAGTTMLRLGRSIFSRAPEAAVGAPPP
ncbi:MAG: YggS family pyridoxal phosphate-dependent enzyme [Candidatus Dormibacterales bacterium]